MALLVNDCNIRKVKTLPYTDIKKAKTLTSLKLALKKFNEELRLRCDKRNAFSNSILKEFKKAIRFRHLFYN
jgi:hypothetical protein